MFATTFPLDIFAVAFAAFMILYLLCGHAPRKNLALPLLTLVSAACSSLYPLLELSVGSWSQSPVISVLFFGQELLSPLTFLLVLQITSARPPLFPGWLIFGVPLGIYGRTLLGLSTEFRLHDQQLLDVVSVGMLLLLLASTLILLKRVPLALGRFCPKCCWLAVQLIVLTLSLLALDLADLTAIISHPAAYSAAAVLRFSFVYRLARGILLDSTLLGR